MALFSFIVPKFILDQLYDEEKKMLKQFCEEIRSSDLVKPGDDFEDVTMSSCLTFEVFGHGLGDQITVKGPGNRSLILICDERINDF